MRLRSVLTILAVTAVGWHLSRSAPQAAPPEAAPPAGKPAFVDQIAPLVAKYCVNCHGPTRQSAGLALHKFTDDASVLGNRKVWLKVIDQLEAQAMPPEDKKQPTADERNRMIAWLKQELVKSDCNGPRDPGKVTIRRLNRAEYNNTIRDLLGVDFQPANDFPSDDVGYGFDNIGDVLSMPPLLLEKYLAAAEKAAEKAIISDTAPKSVKQHFAARELNCTLPTKDSLKKGRYYLYSNGEVSTKFTFPAAGEYVLRAKAGGEQAGPDPTRMAFRVDGKEVKVVDVTALKDAPKDYTATIKVEAGERKIGVAFVNDYFNDKDPDPKKRGDSNLYVDWLEVESPTKIGPVIPDSHKKLFAAGDKAKSEDEKAAAILTEFTRKAFRRPVTDAEAEKFVKFAKSARTSGETFERSIQLGVQAVLVSPHFLFRVELDREPTNPDAHPISDFELATRLSYFLWSSMPDEELFGLAKKGELRKPGVIDAQVKRMLKDPKAKALTENFAGQWLQLRNLAGFAPDGRMFRGFGSLRPLMVKETELFFEYVVREDRNIMEFIDADYTFVNERLARHYSIPNVKGEDFQKVKLTDSLRGGLLTQASILTVTSNPTRTSPVKRGKWILENILGTPPPPPPPDVPELNEGKDGVLTGSLRQRMEQHRSKTMCASCHQKMDPLGFAFENFGVTGEYRTKDGNFDIDPAGTLPDGKTFKGPKELKQILTAKDELFRKCLSEKLLTYALGRGVEDEDRCHVDKISSVAAKNGNTFTAMVTEIVKSEPFQLRRGNRGAAKP
jgi:hypothetical protein